MNDEQVTQPTSTDEVDLALRQAQVQAQRDRLRSIDNLLDTAIEILDATMTEDSSSPLARLNAAQTAVNLYLQKENGARQDKALELQERRLAMEEAKLRLPTAQLNQTNIYLSHSPDDKAKAEAELLARKQAQNQILGSYLGPQKEIEDTDQPTTQDLIDNLENSENLDKSDTNSSI